MDAYFAKLRENLEPNPTFSEIIQTRHAAVRAQLAPDSHLIGSLQRRTRIQPLPGQPFDIDILAVLGSFASWTFVGGITAAAAIQYLLNKAQASDRYSVKNPTPDSPTVTLQFANDIKVEIVPAYLDNIGRNPSGTPYAPVGRAYWVPDRAGGWMLADYDYDAQYVTDSNERSDGYLVPAIKILKAIKRRHFPALKSFALEILAARNIPLIVEAYKSEHADITYPALLRLFFQLAKPDLAQSIAIPGSLSAPIVLTPAEIAHIGERFDAIRAGIAESAPLSDSQKIPYWRAIVGDVFPAGV